MRRDAEAVAQREAEMRHQIEQEATETRNQVGRQCKRLAAQKIEIQKQEAEMRRQSAGISLFHNLLLMMKCRHLSVFNSDNENAFEEEMRRQDSFHAKWPKFARFANRYFTLVCLCDFGRSTGMNDSDIELIHISEFSITSIVITQIKSMLRHDNIVLSVIFSRCGQFLASGDSRNLVLRRSDGSDVFKKPHSDQNASVDSVCFSADSRRVISACRDSVVRVFDVDGGNEVMELRGHSGGVLSVTCSNDGTLIATGASDLSLRLWDANTGAEIWKFDHVGIVICVAFNNDGTRVASSFMEDGSLRVFSIQERRLIHEVKTHDCAICCAFSNDSCLIVSGGDPGEIILFDTDTFTEVRKIQLSGHPTIYSVTFDPSSRFIASGTGMRLRVFEVATGEEVFRFDGHKDSVESVTWSPCGNLLVSGSMDYTVRIHDVSHLKYRRRRAAQVVEEE